jgi:hypothetical protein
MQILAHMAMTNFGIQRIGTDRVLYCPTMTVRSVFDGKRTVIARPIKFRKFYIHYISQLKPLRLNRVPGPLVLAKSNPGIVLKIKENSINIGDLAFF